MLRENLLFQKIFLSLILFLVITGIFNCPVFSQNVETITISTYYPSPVGVYRELRAKRAAIGDTYYDASQYCWGGGCANQINANADLVTEGDVGIGTFTPGAKLDVAGAIRFGHRDCPNCGGLLYTSNSDTSGNFGGKEVVLTVADGIGGDNDAIGIGTRVGLPVGESAKGYIHLFAKNIWLQTVNTGAPEVGAIWLGGNVIIDDNQGVARSPAPNSQHGNLDVNDVWVRAANSGNGGWASQLGGECITVKKENCHQDECRVYCPAGYSAVSGGWWGNKFDNIDANFPIDPANPIVSDGTGLQGWLVGSIGEGAANPGGWKIYVRCYRTR